MTRAGSILGLLFGLCLALGLPQPARAIDEAAAIRHVVGTIDEITRLMTGEFTVEERADALLRLIETRSAPEPLARYMAGDAWERMTGDQRRRFTAATMGFAARTYARQFRKVSASLEEIRKAVHLRGTHDAGRKGLLVLTEIRAPRGPAVRIDYLVSDRTGRLAVLDLMIEGISMAVTHRELVLAMLRDAGGDAEQVILKLSRH